MAIERTTTVQLVGGQKIVLTKETSVDVFELTLTGRNLNEVGYPTTSYDQIQLKFHVTRDYLVQHGVAFASRPPENPPTKTPEDLLVELLQSIGVKFEE